MSRPAPSGVRQSGPEMPARIPFDWVRTQYAQAVRFGLIRPSLLASASFERNLCALERFSLGPWARRA